MPGKRKPCPGLIPGIPGSARPPKRAAAGVFDASASASAFAADTDASAMESPETAFATGAAQKSLSAVATSSSSRVSDCAWVKRGEGGEEGGVGGGAKK